MAALRCMFVVFAGICAAALFPGSAAGAAQPSASSPSFDCSKARTNAETIICRDPALTAADALMARLYAAAQVSAFGHGPSNQLAAQREWRKDRSNACTGLKRSEQPACLVRFLNARNQELATAALFAEPRLALETLHRLDPAGAPLLEAIYRYASEPLSADWNAPSMAAKRMVLLGLLEPYAERFSKDEALSYGRDILNDEKIGSASDALGSDRAFARFVAITSAYIEGGPVPRPVPCAAIVRHPALIDMEGPAFGSTLDNFIVSAACPDELPPAPQLTRLANQIIDSWPQCEGTIRYSAYRNFGTSIDSALLATDADMRVEKAARMPRVPGVSAKQLEAAIAELTAYYREYRRSSAANAPALARGKLRAMMEAAHDCG